MVFEQKAAFVLGGVFEVKIYRGTIVRLEFKKAVGEEIRGT